MDEQTGFPEVSRKEVILYALGDLGNVLAAQFPIVLTTFLVVAMEVSPLWIGLILGLTLLLGAPFEAVFIYVTDHTRSRWGRRRPYILVGGVLRVLLLVLIVAFFPRTPTTRTNTSFAEEQKAAQVLASEMSSEECAPPSPKYAPPPAPRIDSGLSVITQALKSLPNDESKSLLLYLFLALLALSLLTTVQTVPYTAMRISLSPSYDGRTRVIIYTGVLQNLVKLGLVWIPFFCFLPLFKTALDGLFWFSIITCLIGIPSTVMMCRFTKEHTGFVPTRENRIGYFRTIGQIAKNRTLWRIIALYTIIGIAINAFMSLGLYLNIYWVMGDALSGAKQGARIGMLVFSLGWLVLPVISWGCRKFEKHRFMRFALIWMAVGTALHWWCMVPGHPEYQFILPFFYSVGIVAIFTILPALMADITDVDELNHGVRREAMFGMVSSFCIGFWGRVVPILAGVVLMRSGFDASLHDEQLPSTILHMRLLYSFVPAGLLLAALIFLRRYPLTRARVVEIQNQLRLRHDAEQSTD